MCVAVCRREQDDTQLRDNTGSECLLRWELHVGELANEFRSRRESISVPIPSGDFQRVDPNHEWRDRLQGGEYNLIIASVFSSIFIICPNALLISLCAGRQAADSWNEHLHVPLLRVFHYIWIVFYPQSVHWSDHRQL